VLNENTVIDEERKKDVGVKLYRRVALWVGTNVSDERTSSIFRRKIYFL
jgi:hypothetical protein